MYQKKVGIIQREIGKGAHDDADFGTDCECSFNLITRGRWLK